MTLCIAAKTFGCSVVLCHDHKIETQTAQADIGHKFRCVSRDWIIMMAGSYPVAMELAEVYEHYLAVDHHDLSLIERLRVPIGIFRNRCSEHFCQSRFAVSHQEFMKSGFIWLGDQLFRESLADLRVHIESEERKIQLIVVGLDDQGLFRIFKYSFGELWECDSFAAIGSGETIAEAALFLRKVTELRDLSEIAYTVYEAKRAGEITPGVGTSTTMLIARPCDDGLRWTFVSDAGLAFLEKRLNTLGPKPYKHSKLPAKFVSVGYGEWLRDEPNPEEESASLELTTHDPKPRHLR